MLAKSAAGFIRSASTNSVRGRPSISFRFRRARTSCVPTKPAPPVIKTLIVFLPCASFTVLVQLGATTFETASTSSSRLPILRNSVTNKESMPILLRAPLRSARQQPAPGLHLQPPCERTGPETLHPPYTPAQRPTLRRPGWSPATVDGESSVLGWRIPLGFSFHGAR